MCQLSESSAPAAVPEAPHDYWVIHGQAYDLASYVAKHPGGVDAILLGRGRDCTELFEQYHVLNNKHLRVLERFRISLPSSKLVANNLKGTLVSAPIDRLDSEADAAAVIGLQKSAFSAHQSDPFYEDVKAMVREHGNTKMSTPFMILHCLHVVGLVYSLRLWYQGAFISAFLLPYFLWVLCAALVHDGGHFALSRNASVNKILNLTAALITNSSGCWYLQHNILHHSYTNLHGKDCDLDSHHPYMRIHPEQSLPPTTVHHVLRLLGHLAMYLMAHLGLTVLSPVTYFRGLMARRKGHVDAKTAQDVQTLAQYHASIVLQASDGSQDGRLGGAVLCVRIRVASAP
ncbi:hypothetical protein VOLCADRAFT_92130 [Volvox carteri f. nagariensis]|uniref:Cytochrome b5 heme-binding domain-containing protein n=1 Tax=Volvox carteri f. nagariensis TaxID=3068 RepID=D8TYP1_VOLCA|nr:uncharacterized protein VOLCADRAFT_92130 [Volvox carteri f. nagariensis]EFJ47347.1 hypothetical protein VOLCADRAFT_92130 [Volvox carteri f. nagariensis]|eukprot:XP_002951536.1 hypothetical protein VOLCADRAFT_92130 [Volvox carteri f. nagariensis]